MERHAEPSLATRSAGAVAATAALGALGWWAAHAFGTRGVLFALTFNWLAMCWMGTAGRLFPPPLPERYFAIRPFERSARLYEALGVRVLKRLVRRGPLHLFNPHLRLPPDRSAAALLRLEARMREPEAAHAVLFVLVLPVAVHAALRGWWWVAAWTLVFDLALNLWPVLLQRYNRAWLLAQVSPGRTFGTGAPNPRGVS